MKILSFMLFGFGLVLNTQSAPVASMLSADAIEVNAEAWTPTAADYVQDGLVCMWDAIENGGPGIHDPTLNKNTWVEWCGTGWKMDADRGGFFGDDWFGQTEIRDAYNTGVSSGLRSLVQGTFTWEVALGEIFSSVTTDEEPVIGCYGNTVTTSSGRTRYMTKSYPSEGRVGHKYNETFPWIKVSPLSEINIVHIHDRDRNEGRFLCFENWRPVAEGTRRIPEDFTVTYIYGQYFARKCHCIRIYNRVLSDNEMAWNRLVDAVRFYAQ